jgi:ribosomal protein L1
MELVGLMEVYINETYNEVHAPIGKLSSSREHIIQNYLKLGDALSPLLLNFVLKEQRSNKINRD